MRIELVIPAAIERVGPIDALSVAADFNHLRAIDELFAVRVLGFARDAAQLYLARQNRVHRVADVILMHLSKAPAGDIEVFVIKAQVDVGDQRRHRAKAFQKLGQILWVFWTRINGDDLFGLPFAVVGTPPCKDRALQVGGIHHNTTEAIGLGRIMRRADFQRHLIVFTKVDGLNVLARTQIPEVDRVAVFIA